MVDNPSTQQMSLQQAFLLARSHFEAGRYVNAESLCRQILNQHPGQPQTIGLLGLLANQRGEFEKGIELLRQAIASVPNIVVLHNDLANLLAGRGRLEEATISFAQVAALLPNRAEAHVNLATLLLRLGRIEESETACEKALAIQPPLAEAHNAKGNVRFRQARFDQAVEAYREAVKIQPANASFHNNLASALAATGELTEAIACCERAVALQPGLVAPDSNRIYMMHFHPRYDAESILEQQRKWAQRHATLARDLRPHTNDRSPDRRLKIGYVSADFRDHILGRYLLPILREHDRNSFEITCYSDTCATDSITEQFRSLATTWRGTSGLGHRELAQRVRGDQIDILVDTTLHMSGSRLLAFAHKPAPVQVTFAGYPGGTGMDAIDYRLTDPHLDPPGEHDPWYVEQSIRLPDTFWCYQPIGQQPAANPLPALSNGYVTFGCLNNFAKVNPLVLGLWANVLSQVDRSRLLLLAPQGQSRQKALAVMQQHGIVPERIEFVMHQPRNLYLQTYHRIDIGLDTFPYNGHMTSLDALWMGVPMVTMVGQTAVGRAGWSQLSNLGLTELAARSDGEFVHIATSLAADTARLENLRSTLRHRMLQSPLTDAAGFTRGVEEAFRRMWQTWCACSITSS
jgi:predicted O-linked N-acetylglucosamine transferase (SPINDLY family)